MSEYTEEMLTNAVAEAHQRATAAERARCLSILKARAQHLSECNSVAKYAEVKDLISILFNSNN